MKKKIIITITMLALIICLTIGGTLAWLMDTTDPVQNTFTSGDVDITLVETPNTNIEDDDPTNHSWSAQMIPGNTYAKDPKVTVKGAIDAVDCWLFVKVEEKEVKDKDTGKFYLNYSFRFDDDSEWQKLDIVTEEGTTVWYREVTASETDQSWYLLDGKEGYANGYVEVNATAVTKETVDTAANAELVFTAYAAQKDNRTVDEAWALFNQN